MTTALASSRRFTLDDLRARATTVYTALAWLHVPAAIIIAVSSHNAWTGPAIALAVAALIATVCARALPDGLAVRLILATVLTLGPIAFVYAARGGWQIDYHLYFFAIFAMLVGYVDWRPIVLSAGITAGHHLLLDLVDPSAVFPEEGLARVALHAICVVAECAVLIWIINTIHALFTRIDDLMDFTTKATAEAIAETVAEKVELEAEVRRLQSLR